MARSQVTEPSNQANTSETILASTSASYLIQTWLEPTLPKPIAILTACAVRCGLIREGDKLDRSMLDFASDVMEHCAREVEGYGDSVSGSNAAERIRSVLQI